MVFFNHGDSDMVIRRSDAVASLLLERVAASEIEEAPELPGPLLQIAAETTSVPKRWKCRWGRRSAAAVDKRRHNHDD